MRLAAYQIADKNAVGRFLAEFSHLGEEPESRPVTDKIGFAFDKYMPIVAVRQTDDDNIVAVLLGQLLDVTARDEDGKVLRDQHGKPLRVIADPPQGWVEVGIGPDGWIDAVTAEDIAAARKTA